MNKREIIPTLLIFVLVIGVGAYIKTQAGSSQSAGGWLWGGSEETDDGIINGNETGVGWISINSTNCDKDNNGFIDVRYCDLDNNTFVDVLCRGDNATDVSASCGGNNTTTPVVDYGVNIPPSGAVTGFAWSPNLGWIDFGPATNCVADSDNILDNLSPRYEADSCTPPAECAAGEVSRSGDDLAGCARIVSVAQASVTGNSGGWTGWINMKGTATDGTEYGAEINGASMGGYAWSGGETGPELGWIDFSWASIDIKTLEIELSANPNSCSGCASLNSTLTASRLPSSNTTGDIKYEFDCTNDGTIDGTYTTANTSQTHSCSYPASAIARVRMTQGGVENTATAIVALIPVICGDGMIGGLEECDEAGAIGPCPASCSANCKRNDCGGYIEVKP